MDSRISMFIAQKKHEDRIAIEREKSEFLYKNGLFDREYSASGAYSAEYPEFEWDPQSQQGRYYKKIPLSITDEEYAELKAVCGEPTMKPTKSNVIGTFLLVLAILIYIGGFIAGLVMGSTRYDFHFDVALIYWVGALAVGSLFLALAEIVRLLDIIKNK